MHTTTEAFYNLSTRKFLKQVGLTGKMVIYVWLIEVVGKQKTWVI